MKRDLRIIQALFALPWLVFGAQHFIYAGFVATLVPAFLPFKLFLAYLTGAAMIAAGVSFIVNKFSSLAALLLGVMLIFFILLIHFPALFGNAFDVKIWTRPLQDVALASAAFLLSAQVSRPVLKSEIYSPLVKISQTVFALMLLGFAVQQFFNLDALTAKIPQFLPLRIFWVYLTGTLMALAGVSVIINRNARLATFVLGALMLAVNLLNHGFSLFSDFSNPILWTIAMLDLAVTFGVFILAASLRQKESTIS